MNDLEWAWSRSAANAQGLTPDALQAADALLHAAWEVGIPLWISSGRRQLSEQRELLRAGTTRTLRSAHLRGDAFDFDVRHYGRDEVPAWWWESLGDLGESLGLSWGGRFRTLRDLGHFEVPR